MFIQDGRLTLRDFETADIDRLYKIFSVPGFSYAGVKPSYEAARYFVEKAREQAVLKDENGVRLSMRLALFHSDYGLVGYCGLGKIDPLKFMQDGYELGAFVSPEFDGKGYGLKAARLLLGRAVEIGIHKFYGTAVKTNRPSIRIQQHLGFKLQRDLTPSERAFYPDGQERYLFSKLIN